MSPQVVRRTGIALMLCMLVVLWSPAANAQSTQAAEWQRSTPGTRGVALALDAGDNAYVVGVTATTIYDAGVGTLTLARYAPNGTLQWNRTWNDGAAIIGNEYAGVRTRAVFADPAGNAYVIGDLMFFNRTVSTNGSPSTIIGVAPYGWLLFKYAADGSLLWVRHQNTLSWVGVRGMADAAGNVYALVDASSSGTTMRTLKFSAETGALLWTAITLDGAKPGGMVLTSAGNPVVSMASTSSFGLSVVEYNAATGTEVVHTNYPQAAGYYAPALAIGPNGEIVVGGRSSDGTASFVAARSASGVPLFANIYPQSAQATHLGIDNAGQIAVSGVSTDALTNWVTFRLNGAGNLVQGPLILDRSSSVAEAPRDMLVLADGTVVVVGNAGDPANTTVTKATTVRYAADGSTSWIAVAAAPTVVDAALSRNGAAFVLADTDQTLTNYYVGPAIPKSMTITPTSVKGTRSASGMVTLSSSTGAVVTLTSSHPAIVNVPPSVTVQPGISMLGFGINTTKVRTATAVTITATANGRSVSAVLTVTR